MIVRFANVTEKFRYSMNEVIEYINDNTNTVSELNDCLIKCLMHIKNNNYELYTELIGLLASDHYKQLIDKKFYSMLTENDEEKLQLYEELYDQDALIDLYDNNENLLVEALLEMYNFNFCDYFYKRQVMLRFKDDFSVLRRFSNLNVYDYLYYCQKYNIEILESIYKDSTQNGLSKNESINLLVDTLDELGMVDIQNYVDLVSELLLLYYNISKYELDNYKHIDKLNILKKNILRLEKAHGRDLIQKFNDNKFVSEVLHRIINFNFNDVEFTNNDEVYKHTIKKLESIKRIIT